MARERGRGVPEQNDGPRDGFSAAERAQQQQEFERQESRGRRRRRKEFEASLSEQAGASAEMRREMAYEEAGERASGRKPVPAPSVRQLGPGTPIEEKDREARAERIVQRVHPDDRRVMEAQRDIHRREGGGSLDDGRLAAMDELADRVNARRVGVQQDEQRSHEDWDAWRGRLESRRQKRRDAVDRAVDAVGEGVRRTGGALREYGDANEAAHRDQGSVEAHKYLGERLGGTAQEALARHRGNREERRRRFSFAYSGAADRDAQLKQRFGDRPVLFQHRLSEAYTDDGNVYHRGRDTMDREQVIFGRTERDARRQHGLGLWHVSDEGARSERPVDSTVPGGRNAHLVHSATNLPGADKAPHRVVQQTVDETVGRGERWPREDWGTKEDTGERPSQWDEARQRLKGS